MVAIKLTLVGIIWMEYLVPPRPQTNHTGGKPRNQNQNPILVISAEEVRIALTPADPNSLAPLGQPYSFYAPLFRDSRIQTNSEREKTSIPF